MKLTKADKDLLLSWGYDESDFPQIEEAMRKKKTQYELGNSQISREEAIQRLGRRNFLSGIARSAFHYSAVRETIDGERVYFDSSRLFE